MAGKSINHVLAENLARLMEQGSWTQTSLAAKAGVSQKTVSNYLNQDQRSESSTGKQPSAKLSELEKIAQVLEVPVRQLMREMSAREQRLYERIERAYEELRTADDVASAQDAATAQAGMPLRAVSDGARGVAVARRKRS